MTQANRRPRSAAPCTRVGYPMLALKKARMDWSGRARSIRSLNASMSYLPSFTRALSTSRSLIHCQSLIALTPSLPLIR